MKVVLVSKPYPQFFLHLLIHFLVLTIASASVLAEGKLHVQQDLSGSSVSAASPSSRVIPGSSSLRYDAVDEAFQDAHQIVSKVPKALPGNKPEANRRVSLDIDKNATDAYLRLRFDLPGYEITEFNGHPKILLKSNVQKLSYELIQGVWLPRVHLLLSMPEGTLVRDFRVRAASSLMPLQDVKPAVNRDKFGVKYKIKKQGGTSLLALSFRPFQIVSDNLLEVAEVSYFEMKLFAESWEEGAPIQSRFDQDTLRSLATTQRVFFSSNELDSGLEKDGVSADYIVIVPEDYVSNVDSYVQGKIAEGLATEVITLESIVAAYPDGDTTDRILAYLEDTHAQYPFSYLLLVGNEHLIDPKQSDKQFRLQARSLGYYFGRLSLFGHEIEAALQKWIDFNASHQPKRILLTPADTEPALDTFNYQLSPFLGGTNWEIMGAGMGNPLAVPPAFEAGPSFVSYIWHGWPTGWDVFLSGLEVLQMDYYTNHGALPLVLASACLTGNFEYHDDRFSILDPRNLTMGEAFLSAPNGGAVGYLGSRVIIQWPDAYRGLEQYYRDITDEWRQTGKVAVGRISDQSSISNSIQGDPTAVVNLHPMLPDTQDPVIDPASVELEMSDPTLQGQSVILRANATDDDDIAYIWVEVTHPDATTSQTEMAYSADHESYEGIFRGTQQVGSYVFDVHANDISGNSVMLSGASFVVAPDTEAPNITNLYIERTEMFPFQSVYLTATMNDNSGVVIPEITVVRPDASEDTYQTTSLSYQNTDLVGTYHVIFKAEDLAGNVTIDSTMAFEVLADSNPPLMPKVWVRSLSPFVPPFFDQNYDTPDPYRIQDGHFIALYAAVWDEYEAFNLQTWAEVRAPSGKVTTLPMYHAWEEWEHAGVIYPVHRIDPTPLRFLEGEGLYTLTIYAEDLMGNRSFLEGPRLIYGLIPEDRFIEMH